MARTDYTNQVKTIYRASRRGDGYTHLLNGLLQDRRMTYGTIGLLGFLLSHSERWLIEVDRLIRTTIDVEKNDVFRPNKREGEKAILAMIQEAKYYRYMGCFKTERNEQGQFLKTIYWVTDDPSNPPLSPCELVEYNQQNGENLVPLTMPHLPQGGMDTATPETSEGSAAQNPLKQAQIDNLTGFRANAGEINDALLSENSPPTPPRGRRGTLLEKNNINNNYYNNNLNINAGGVLEIYPLAIEAYQAYCDVQEDAHFQKVYSMSPERLARLNAAIEAVGGIEVWKDHLQRAVHSKFCRGDSDVGDFKLGIDGMANTTVLEKISNDKLYLKVTDPQWQAWQNWAEENDNRLFRIMEMVVKKDPVKGVYHFASSKPPASSIEPGNGGAA